MEEQQSIVTVDHWIGGEWKKPKSNRYFDDHNPIDDSVYAKAAYGTTDDMDMAVQAAHKAFSSFRNTTPREREAMLCRAADLLESRSDEFVDILIDEGGSPIDKAIYEVQFAADLLRSAAGYTRYTTGKTMPSDTDGQFSMSIRQPVGVIAGITPFNVPLLKGVKVSASALAIGNTVTLLPSEEAPVVAKHLAQLFSDSGFPPGSFNYVTGSGYEIGDSLTTHPLVRSVSFTGSSQVGKHIRILCAEHNKKLILELGGKSPLVVLEDADLDKAAADAAFSSFTFQGQVCMAASRIFVISSIYSEFIEKFKKAAKSLGMGDMRDLATDLGPLISERQRNRVRDHIEDAVAKGARIEAGGQWHKNRCEPTILTGVKPGMKVYYDETFGPLASVYIVNSAEEALQRANDTVYGLSASIYTSDIKQAMRYALEVESGMVHINAPTPHDEPHVPFGGVGQSGFGREGIDGDLEAMTEWKWITIQL